MNQETDNDISTENIKNNNNNNNSLSEIDDAITLEYSLSSHENSIHEQNVLKVEPHAAAPSCLPKLNQESVEVGPGPDEASFSNEASNDSISSLQKEVFSMKKRLLQTEICNQNLMNELAVKNEIIMNLVERVNKLESKFLMIQQCHRNDSEDI